MGLAEAGKPPRSPECAPHNLPLELSSFVGREKELAEVKRCWGDPPADAHRLGRLAARRGWRWRLQASLWKGFEDGVWMVELASLAEPSLVAQAVASTLGVREQPGRSLTETLSDYLASKKVLLVLDNCEHSDRGLRRARRGAAAFLSRVACACHQPRGSGHRRRGRLARPLALPPDLRRMPEVESLSRYESGPSLPSPNNSRR